MFWVLLLPVLLFAEGIWEPTEYMWNLGLMLTCDKKMKSIPQNNFDPAVYKNVCEGDVLWIRSEWFGAFINEALPFIKHRFVLVSGDGDHSMPLHFHKNPKFFLDDKRLIHWFVQNYDYEGTHPKLSPIPIGIDFHTFTTNGLKNTPHAVITPKMQEATLKEILSTLKPTRERIPKALCDFHFNNSSQDSFTNFKKRFGEVRSDIHMLLKDHNEVVFLPRPLPRALLWKMKGEYAFSISPHGVGLDCHRTWEDLTLGCIVIVKTSPLDPLYEGLPVVIVKDWNEVTEANMLLWLDQYGNAFENPSYRQKLTLAYWVQKIRERAQKGL